MMSFEKTLLEKLRTRKTPLSITIGDHGALEAIDYDFDGPWSFSITFFHPEGSIVIGADLPEDADIETWHPELSEGLVGYALIEALPSSEVKRLGLQVMNIGGPGGSVARVCFKGSAKELASTIRHHKLPFTLQV